MNTGRRLLCMLLLSTVIATVGVPIGAAASTPTLHVKLNGPNVVHGGDPNGVADAKLTLDIHKQELCWAFSHLAGIASPTVARISKGSKGRTGPSVLSLGRSYRSKGCVIVRASLLRAILSRPTAYYLTFWAGRKYKDGVVRGQL